MIGVLFAFGRFGSVSRVCPQIPIVCEMALEQLYTGFGGSNADRPFVCLEGHDLAPPGKDVPGSFGWWRGGIEGCQLREGLEGAGQGA